MYAGIIVPLGAFAMTVILAIGVPMARAYARRMENESKSSMPLEVTSRLERMEQAIDAIAVEVERISEGQRFTTKLLSENAKPQTLPASKEKSFDPA